jgi:Phage integrase family/Lactonase, 7-bladed beta-propeller
LFEFSGDALSPAPVFRKDTLAEPGYIRGRQIAGTVHVHPNGRFVYAVNRASTTTEFESKRIFAGGENNFAVYSIDPSTDEPSLIQHVDTRDIHCRTFHIDPSGWPYGALFRLLLLTGQRRDEVAQATWSEFDLKKATWTLRTKNGRLHIVHLAPLAMEILEKLPRIASAKGYVFTTGKGGADVPVNGFTKPPQRLAAAMLARHKAERAKAGEDTTTATIKHFTLHDLRRSAATGMASIGIAPHVVDKILSHSSGKISGIAAIYNRFEYLPERQAALEAWGRHIESLIRPAPSNLREFPKRANA